MLRHFRATEGEPGFAWRAGEMTRLEALSDAVFAFAVTLLVVSLEVPHTFHELLDVMKGFPAFAICFAILVQVWYQHSKFFRRYGLQDTYASFLNCLLLFFVLFYVYPLKFLFTLLVGQISHGLLIPGGGAHDPLSQNEGSGRMLLVIYGLGFAAVFGVFALLYQYAYRKAADLELNELEMHRTRHSLLDNCVMVLIGLVSASAAVLLPDRWVGFAGLLYFTVGIYETIASTIFGKKDRLIQERMEDAAQASSLANPPAS